MTTRTLGDDRGCEAIWGELQDLPVALRRDLRSDHAGERGAVSIYRGILLLARDGAVRRFAREHLAVEQSHLGFFERSLPQPLRTRVPWLWALAGFVLGVLATLGGRRGVWLTIEAVEAFVVAHYQAQIDDLAARPGHQRLRSKLIEFQADEAHHRDDAGNRTTARPGLPGRCWQMLVGRGSAIGVIIARRL